MQENSSTKKTTAKRQGQIIKNGKDKYVIRVYLYRTAEGKRVYYNTTITGTRKDAENFLTEYLQKKNNRVLRQPPSDRNFFEFGEDFFTNVSNARRRNRELDLYKLKRYVKPHLGHFKLKDITSTHIANLFLELKKTVSKITKRNLSGTTRKHIYSILFNIFAYAEQRKLIIDNPIKEIVPPRVDTKEIYTFSPEQAQSFLKAMDEGTCNYSNGLFNRVRPMFHLALECGLRPEEYLGLQWKYVDFGDSENNIPATIQVRKVLVRMPNNGEWWFDEPKTRKSKRSIPISANLVEKLLEQRQKLETWKKQAKVWNENDLVFPNNKGEPHYIDSIRKLFKKILKWAEIEPSLYSLYSLRHSCATLLLRANIHPKVVSERLGHSSIAITLDIYSHCLPTMQESATKNLVKMIYD